MIAVSVRVEGGREVVVERLAIDDVGGGAGAVPYCRERVESVRVLEQMTPLRLHEQLVRRRPYVVDPACVDVDFERAALPREPVEDGRLVREQVKRRLDGRGRVDERVP